MLGNTVFLTCVASRTSLHRHLSRSVPSLLITSDNDSVRFLPKRTRYSHECVVLPSSCIWNQEATFVPVAERNKHCGAQILFVASPLGIFFNVPTWCIRREPLHPSLLDTRSRDSDFIQVCFAALFVLIRHFLPNRPQQLLKIRKILRLPFLKRLKVLSKMVFITFLIPDSSRSPITYLQIVLLQLST